MAQDRDGSALSSGIEQLLALAAVDPDFATGLLSPEKREQTLSRGGVVLTPGEQRLLASLTGPRLEQLVAGVKRAMHCQPDPARRALVGGAAATLLGALATGGCASDGSRRNIRIAVEAYRARVTAGGSITGIRPGGGTGFGLRGRRRLLLVVRQKKLATKGGLSREIVRRIARRHLNELRYCFLEQVGLESFDEARLGARALKRPIALTATFVITSSGRVVSVRLKHCSLTDKPLARKLSSCVLGAIGRWLYPKPRDGRPVQVEYGLSFEVVDPRKRKKPKKKRKRLKKSRSSKPRQ